jgi:hypothetical protein
MPLGLPAEHECQYPINNQNLIQRAPDPPHGISWHDATKFLRPKSNFVAQPQEPQGAPNSCHDATKFRRANTTRNDGVERWKAAT